MSFFKNWLTATKPSLLMTNTDVPANQEAINSQTQNIPKIKIMLKMYTKRRSHSADEYMSKKLLEAFLNQVDFNDRQNKRYFFDFAKQLIWNQLRGDEYEVFGYKNNFIIHNISGNYNYRCTFN